MNDYNAILQSVLNDPDDNFPRLVLADWLEEHGNFNRAEMIRVRYVAGADRAGMAIGHGGAQRSPKQDIGELRHGNKEAINSKQHQPA